MAVPQEIIDGWDSRISDEEKKEVYEVLLGQKEFGTFLMILKEKQMEAYKLAQAHPSEAAFYLGAGEIIDQVRADIVVIQSQ